MCVCVLLLGRKEIVEILLDAGMDPNCLDGATGRYLAQLLHQSVYVSISPVYTLQEHAHFMKLFDSSGGL